MIGRAVVAGALALALPACLIDVDYTGTMFRCDDAADCPGGLACNQGFCTGTNPVDAAAGADAPLADACVTCEPGMVLRWTFNEPGGATVVDVSGNGFDGALENAARVAGLDGGAIQLDDALDQVILAAAPALLKPTGALAIAVWIQVADLDDGEVVGLGDSYAIRAVTGGAARIFVYNGVDWTGATSVSTINDGGWHHVVGQLTGTRLEIYVDGVLDDAVDHSMPIDYSLGPDLVAGKHGNGEAGYDFVGLIDDIRIYDRALDQGEIDALSQP